MFRLILLIALTANLAVGQELQEKFQEAVSRVAPSVVTIETAGGMDKIGKVLKGQGPTTGLAITSDGYIVTSSFNFVQKPASIIVSLPGGVRCPAELVASDLTRKVTLLKVDAELRVPEVAETSSVRVGQWSIAVGRTWGEDTPAISVGIISALNRVWGKAIQTDAKVSPTNYGGPLLDLKGRVLGVLVPLSPTAEGEMAGVEWYDSGIGFAVPIQDIQRVLENLKKGSDLKRGLIGVGLDQSLYKKNVVITHVFYKSPAAAAGLAKDDQIVELDGKPISRQVELRYALANKYAGDVVLLKIKRGKELLDIELTLSDKLGEYERPMIGIIPARKPEKEKGVRIRHVLQDSLASSLGLEPGDFITKFDDKPANNRQQLVGLLSRRYPAEKIALEIRRGEETLKLEGELSVYSPPVPQELKSEALDIINFQPTAETGDLSRSAGKPKRDYWAFVPANYEPNYPMGLVVWIHPPGTPLREEVQSAWAKHCRARNIALIGILSTNERYWSRMDTAVIPAAVADFRKAYKVDPTRIVVHGLGKSASLAFQQLQRQKRLFRGIITSGVTRKPVIDKPNAAALTSFLVIVDKSDDRASKATMETVNEITEQRHPIIVHGTESVSGYFDAAAVELAARWLDSLDRL